MAGCLAFTLNLRDDQQLIDRYKQHHAAVWPTVEASLRRVGVRLIRIFLRGRQLFMYMEVEDNFDPSTYVEQYLQEPLAAEWENLMRELQEPVPGARPGEWWASMEQIYELQSPARVLVEEP